MAPVTTTDKNVAFSRSRSRERIHEEIGDLETFERILAFAIDEEKKSCDFYLGLAKRMRHQWMSKAFARLAREERRQRERLLRMRFGPCSPPIFEKAPPPKLTEHARAAVILADELESRDALAVAIRAKVAAQRLYMDLAAKTKDVNLKVVFRAAAAAEAKQKASFEAEYAARFPDPEPKRK
jgi:rubrerythrin